MSAFVLPRWVERHLDRAALAAILAYQRFISPYKGFSCAYRVHTGRASCSALGHRAVRWRGLFTGLGLIRERLQRCSAVYRQAHRGSGGARRGDRSQRGDCDCFLPVVPDLGDCAMPCDAGDACRVGDAAQDVARCCDACSCGDCGGSERKKPKPQQGAGR